MMKSQDWEVVREGQMLMSNHQHDHGAERLDLKGRQMQSLAGELVLCQIDAGGYNATGLPNLSMKTFKAGFKQLCVKITNAIVSGRSETGQPVTQHIHVCTPVSAPHNLNLSLTILTRVVLPAAVDLKVAHRTLSLQTDRASDEVNKYKVGALCSLVVEGVVDTVNLSFLLVAHSHFGPDVDAAGVNLALVALGADGHTADTKQEMMRRLSEVDGHSAVWLPGCDDFITWLGGKIDPEFSGLRPAHRNKGESETAFRKRRGYDAMQLMIQRSTSVKLPGTDLYNAEVLYKVRSSQPWVSKGHFPLIGRPDPSGPRPLRYYTSEGEIGTKTGSGGFVSRKEMQSVIDELRLWSGSSPPGYSAAAAARLQRDWKVTLESADVPQPMDDAALGFVAAQPGDHLAPGEVGFTERLLKLYPEMAARNADKNPLAVVSAPDPATLPTPLQMEGPCANDDVYILRVHCHQPPCPAQARSGVG
jgi:hypothetical protein